MGREGKKGRGELEGREEKEGNKGRGELEGSEGKEGRREERGRRDRREGR